MTNLIYLSMDCYLFFTKKRMSEFHKKKKMKSILFYKIKDIYFFLSKKKTVQKIHFLDKEVILLFYKKEEKNKNLFFVEIHFISFVLESLSIPN